MTKKDTKILIKATIKKIENIVEDLIEILDLLKKENDTTDKEMVCLVLCKQKTISLCENVLFVFRDIVRMKYTYVNISVSKKEYKELDAFDLEACMNENVVEPLLKK